MADLNMKTEREREKALTDFNDVADFYDDYRPDYPREAVETIIAKANLTSGSKILEIGAGSGKATVQFSDFGFEMLCIEPGSNLVDRGNRTLGDKNIKFIASRFEDYDEPSKYYDAIISAQAFHWITQPIGYKKCANTLKDNGLLAMFWQLDLYNREIDFDREFVDILDKYSGWVSCMPEKDYSARMESILSKIVGSGLFSKPEIIHFYWDQVFTADEYYKYMLTGAPFAETDAERQACREDLARLADKYDGIKRRFMCELYLTRKV